MFNCNDHPRTPETRWLTLLPTAPTSPVIAWLDPASRRCWDPRAARAPARWPGYDEDATSMAVEAARGTLRALAGPRWQPERLLFATASPPYLDKTNANVVHAALRLDPGALAVDVVGSVRSGVGA